MFISEITKNGVKFTAHETAEEAVTFILDYLGSDYEKDFWASEDGKELIANTGSRLDFSAAVYNSAEAAIRANSGLDEDDLPAVLRILADAVEKGTKNAA